MLETRKFSVARSNRRIEKLKWTSIMEIDSLTFPFVCWLFLLIFLVCNFVVSRTEHWAMLSIFKWTAWIFSGTNSPVAKLTLYKRFRSTWRHIRGSTLIMILVGRRAGTGKKFESYSTLECNASIKSIPENWKGSELTNDYALFAAFQSSQSIVHHLSFRILFFRFRPKIKIIFFQFPL